MLFSILGYFLPFYPLYSPKNQINQIKKSPGDITILHMYTKNHDHMLYCSWDMALDRCNCYFSFWAIFCPFISLTAQKIKIFKKWKKKKKKCQEISTFYICAPKSMIKWCMVPEMWCATDGGTDGRTDGWKKWHIEVGAPPKNTTHINRNGIYIAKRAKWIL